MTKLFDLENGNWENSEVMRIFAELMDQQALECDDKVPADEMPPIDVEMSTDADGKLNVEIEPKTAHAAIAAEFDLIDARRSLAKLASSAAAAGDVKAAYLVERALAELDELAGK